MAKVPNSLIKSNLEKKDSLRKEKAWETIRYITTRSINSKEALLNLEYSLEDSKRCFDKDSIVHALENPVNGDDYYHINMKPEDFSFFIKEIEYQYNEEQQNKNNEIELQKIEQRLKTLQDNVKPCLLYSNSNIKHSVRVTPYTIEIHYDDSKESSKILNLHSRKTENNPDPEHRTSTNYRTISGITINIHRYLVEFENPEKKLLKNGQTKTVFYSYKEIQDNYYLFVRDFAQSHLLKKGKEHLKYINIYTRWIEALNDYIKYHYTHWNTKNCFELTGSDYDSLYESVFKTEFDKLSKSKDLYIPVSSYKVFIFYTFEMFVLIDINSLIFKKKNCENFAIINFNPYFDENGNINGVKFISEKNYQSFTKQDIDKVIEVFSIDSSILYDKLISIQNNTIKEKVIAQRKKDPKTGARKLSVMFNVPEGTIKNWIKGL